MSSWSSFVADCAHRHGVGTVAWAVEAGVSRDTFYRRARSEGWENRYAGVMILPGTGSSLKTDLMAFCAATRVRIAVAGRSALWLHGLEERPPKWQQVVALRDVKTRPAGRIHARRARWLEEGDIELCEGIPTLAVAPCLLTMGTEPERDLRATVLQARQRGDLDLAAARMRLSRVGPIAGRGKLERLLSDLERRSSESVFDDEVRQELARRGYCPSPGPVRIDTPDGRGLRPDIRLPWNVCVEPQGDAHHRTRRQRRADARRLAQYAGTDTVVVPVDWQDWMLERETVFAAIDAAILQQVERGIGVDHPLPPHLQAMVSGSEAR